MPELSVETTKRVKTGVKGLDDLIEGGLPPGRVILVSGEPGSGKTVLASQFLVSGVREFGETGLFVCMEEARVHLYREMKRFGWDLEGLESAGSLGFVDATPLRLLPEKVNLGEVAIDRGDFSMMTLIQAIKKEVERIKPKRIVIDPISSLIIQYPDIVQRRGAILDLVDVLVSSGATCIMTSELRHTGLKRTLDVEEFLSHGVIILQNHLINGSIVRAIQVEKMRETNCETQPKPYRISSSGIEVFSKESVFR